jgi:hypothetical protein
MTVIFSILTVLALLAVAIFAQTTGMAATSYFGLMAVFGVYVIWCARKPLLENTAVQGS